MRDGLCSLLVKEIKALCGFPLAKLNPKCAGVLVQTVITKKHFICMLATYVDNSTEFCR